MLEVLACIGLALLLIALIAGWVHWMNEGTFLGFWLGWNCLDAAGHVFMALVSIIASMFSNDS